MQVPLMVYKIGVLNLTFTDIKCPQKGFRVSLSYQLYDKCGMCPPPFFLRIVSGCPQTFKGYLDLWKAKNHRSTQQLLKKMEILFPFLFSKTVPFPLRVTHQGFPINVSYSPTIFLARELITYVKFMPQFSRDGLKKALKRWFIPLCTEMNPRYLHEKIVRIIHLAAQSTMSARRTE